MTLTTSPVRPELLSRIGMIVALLFAAMPLTGAFAQQRLTPEIHVLRLTGADANRCGVFQRKRGDPVSLSEAETRTAMECITAAWQGGRPFFLSIEGTGIDSYIGQGVFGLREKGGLYRFAYDSAPCGGPGCPERFTVQLCPAPSEAAPFASGNVCGVPVRRQNVANDESASRGGASRDLPPMRLEPEARHAVNRPAGCEFPGLTLPEDYAVLAAGNYSGRPLHWQIDQSGHQATRMDIRVHRPDKPVMLLLGAYEPTVWNVAWSPGTRIAGVLASGYHRQAIAGLEPGVPVLVSSYDNRHPCGYFYVATDELKKVNDAARRIFLRNVDMVYFAREGVATLGEGDLSRVVWQSSKAVTPESFRDPGAPLAGEAGLLEAVRTGQLRRATPADAEAWGRALAAKLPQRDLPPIAGEGRARPPVPVIHNAYVVLGPFTYPSGLYGAHATTFFVPAGIPLPKGNPGHSTVLDFNTVHCAGICTR